MIRKTLAALAVTAAVATGATAFGTTQAEAKCKFGCGLAIGLGAGVLGSAIVHDSYRHRHHYAPPPRRYRRGCGYVRRQCARNWGYGNSDFYGCLRYEGC